MPRLDRTRRVGRWIMPGSIVGAVEILESGVFLILPYLIEKIGGGLLLFEAVSNDNGIRGLGYSLTRSASISVATLLTVRFSPP